MRTGKAHILTLSLGILFLITLYYHPIQALNQDLGRHLLLGKIILTTHQVPNTNLLSYTNPNFPFLNHHYLSEVIYALLFQAGGIYFLFIATLLCVISAFLLIAHSQKNNALSLGLASLFFIGLMAERTDIRPESFSYLFLSIFIFILFKNREKKTLFLYALPLAQMLWTNLHIYFPIGVAVTGLFFLEKLYQKRNALQDKGLKQLFLVLALCCLAMLINPHFLTGALYPFTVLHDYGYTIEENQTPFFLISLGMQKPSFIFLFPYLTLLWSGLLLLRKKARFIDYLLVLTFTYLSLNAVRNIPLLAIATFPTALYIFDNYFKREIFSNKRLTVATGLLIFILMAAQTHFMTIRNGLGINVQENGKKAVDFLETNNIKGPIFNNFDIGSYLAYRLYPQEKVFIDGRPEAYPSSFIQEVYIPMQQDSSIFEKQVRKYNFNLIFFTHTDQTPWAHSFITRAIQDTRYVPVYLDQDVIMLVKNSSANRDLVEKFGLSRTDTPLSLPKNPSLEDLKKAVNFYALTNQESGLIKMLIALSNRDPSNCDYLRMLTQVLVQSQNPLASIYQSKRATLCP